MIFAAPFLGGFRKTERLPATSRRRLRVHYKFIKIFLLLLPLAVQSAELPSALAADKTQEPAGKPPPGRLYKVAPETPEPLSADAVRELGQLVARQKELLARSAAKTNQPDVGDLAPEFQQLCNDYENFIRRNPRNAAPYASYAMLLINPVLGEHHRAAGFFAKADSLDPGIALVKNQLGNYLAEEGDPVAAINYYLAAIDLAPDEPLYHLQLALLISVARDDFVKSGAWSRRVLDETFLKANARAAELRPDDKAIAYRHALAYYDVESPDWDKALQLWTALEKRLVNSLEKQIVRLHIAKVLIKQNKTDAARATLETITERQLDEQKQKLLAELPPPARTTLQ